MSEEKISLKDKAINWLKAKAKIVKDAFVKLGSNIWKALVDYKNKFVKGIKTVIIPNAKAMAKWYWDGLKDLFKKLGVAIRGFLYDLKTKLFVGELKFFEKLADWAIDKSEKVEDKIMERLAPIDEILDDSDDISEPVDDIE